MSLVKRYTVDRHERAATSSSPNGATTCTAGVMQVKAERCNSGSGQLDDNDQFSMAINDVINSKMEVADDRFSPSDEKTDDRFQTEMPSTFVVDLTASATTALGAAQPDSSSSGQKIPLSLADRRQPILPFTKGTGVVAPEPALRSKCARNAEVIKARYIRSVQQYRKVCSLIELLAAQHAKLQTRRRQLQRTMCSLSNMYRLNKARSLNGQNGSTVPVDVGVSGSRAQFPLSAAVDDVTFYRQSSPPLSADYRPGSLIAVSMSDNVVMLSQDEDFGSEATMMTAENILRGDAVMESDPKCIYMASASPPPNFHHVPKSSPLMLTTTPPLPANIHSANSQMANAASSSSSMGARWKMEAGYDSKTGVRDYGGFGQQPNSRPGAPLQSSRPYPVATVAAHCKSNSIDIPVPDYERPVAAHTLKADLSCYSYMQLCRH